MLEREAARDDSHTWCMFRSDVPGPTWQWLQPLFQDHWPGYDVAFPAFHRELSTAYLRLPAARLALAVEHALGSGLRRGVTVDAITPGGVTTRDGQRFRCRFWCQRRHHR